MYVIARFLLLAFCALFLFSTQVEAQQQAERKLDSLSRVVRAAKADTTVARAHCRQCAQLLALGRKEEALAAAQKGLRLARKLRDKPGIAECLESRGLAELELYRLDSARAALEEAFNRYETLGDDVGKGDVAYLFGNLAWRESELKRGLKYYEQALAHYKNADAQLLVAKALNGISFAHMRLGRYEEALSFAKQSLKLYDAENSKAGAAKTYGSLGSIMFYQGRYVEALEYYERSAALHEATGDLNAAASAANNIGVIYKKQGAYGFALQNFQRCLDIHRAADNKRSQAIALNNIGLVHLETRNYDKAGAQFRKALKTYEAIGDKPGMALALNNIGLVYDEQGDAENGLQYLNQSLALKLEIGDQRGASLTYINIGDQHLENGQLDSAFVSYQKGLELARAVGDAAQEGELLTSMAAVYVAREEPRKALGYAEEGLRLSEAAGNVEGARFGSQILAQAAGDAGDFARAYKAHMLFKKYDDSLKSVSQSREVGRLEAKYDFDKRIAERDRKEALRAAERKREMWIAAAAALGLLLITLLALLSWRAKQLDNRRLMYKSEALRQQSEELRQMSEEMQQQNERLNQTNRQLEELGAFKQGLTNMLVHDLKNPLNVLMGQIAQLETPARRKRMEAAARTMQSLTMNMLDVQKFETAEARPDATDLRISEVAREAAAQVLFLAEEKRINLRNNVPQKFSVRADYSWLVRMAANLLSNAVKFTPPGGAIVLRAGKSARDGFLYFEVADSGPGVPPDQRERIFEKFAKLDDEAGANRHGTGLGLAFCKLAAEAMGGAISVGDAPEGGAAFRVELPVATRGAEELRVAERAEALTGERAPGLAPSDRAALGPLVGEMRKYEIYDASDLLQLLEDGPVSGSPGLHSWRSKIENAVYQLDEEGFRLLLEEAEGKN